MKLAMIWEMINRAAAADPNIFKNHDLYAALSKSRLPTNLPVCPFIAKVYFLPYQLVESNQTGSKA
jgi:hypothetical protein